MSIKFGNVSITTTHNLSISHCLKGVKNKHSNIHGHNYKLEVTFSKSRIAPVSNVYDMLNDSIIPIHKHGVVLSKDNIEKLLNENIISKYNFSLLVWDKGTDNYEFNDFLHDLTLTERENAHIILVPWQPTVVNICIEFYKILSIALSEMACKNIDFDRVELQRIRLYEDDYTFAEYSESLA